MSGYGIWYLLRPTHKLHEQIAKLNEELGSTPLPAHIPILRNIKLFDTAKCLFEAYSRKPKPTFTLPERPVITTLDQGRQLSFALRADIGDVLWEFPISKRMEMFYNDDLKHIKINQKHILPEEYELVIMDCRTRDKTLWKPVTT